MKKSYKIIFLDFDGPMIPIKCCFLHDKKGEIYHKMDPIAVAFMRKICQADKDVRFVISSSWALQGRKEVTDLLIDNDFPIYRLHKDWSTPRKMTSSREFEIREWMRDHPDEFSHWVAIDDTRLFLDSFVKCDSYDGLSFDNYQKIIEKLDIKI